MTELGKAEFGVTTFFTRSHPNDKCGANGLPLTPNSIKVLGKFQYLKTLTDPNICKYLDIVKDKHERLIVASEHYKQNLHGFLQKTENRKESSLQEMAFGILNGLSYLHSHGIVHRNLSKDNILFDEEGEVKLAEYGLYYMTDYGAHVAFPIGKPRYLAPEILCEPPIIVDEHADSEPEVLTPSGPKVDSWSLGIILLEWLLKQELWPSLTVEQYFHKILSLLSTDGCALDIVVKENNGQENLQGLSENFTDFLQKCLTVSVDKRWSATELLSHPVFKDLAAKQVPHRNGYKLFSVELRCEHLEIPTYGESTIIEDFDHMSLRSKEEVYYLWRLAGGDLDSLLKKAGLIKSVPPITILPLYYNNEGYVYGQGRDKAEMLDDTIIIASQDQLRNRLSEVDEAAYYPLLEKRLTNGMTHSSSSADLMDTASLPLVIKERDVEYQFHRIIFYDRLLKGYPYMKQQISKEARVDIPPLVRGHVWAAILEVEGDIQGKYESIDKETPTTTDRQIEVDIPRCHQYHELLSSPTAHAKFKRILKAWVVSHPQYVYWQGLDSLCAPFLALNFDNEALAYACLSNFIPKYLYNFFLKDNSAVIQEYLAVFAHLITFHDPVLSNHLDGIGFIPDLYAIPWFLTMYAHVFPLHKIVHLWDTLLLGNSSFPLCIGVAILRQLRDRLLTFGFNECILLFSDMPEIDIQKCVQDSIKIFCTTPKSATYREHARPGVKVKQEQKINASYYSQDYNDQPSNDLSMEPISLDDLKREKCPRISAEDLIELAELQGSSPTKSPTKQKPTSKPMLIMVDVRNTEDYNRGALLGSVNIPFQTAFTPEGDLAPCPAVVTLNNSKQLVKVIIGNRGKNAFNFANELVRLGHAKVCVLHKGIDVLKQTNLLVVPSTDF